uniref:NADH-ubiquinone oxidoreductase chain 5 n=1 Tax=Xenogryllus marmoratus TaxID=323499 RepID=A0A7L9QD09_9ORTH|nr:NADH dehydrogenase subunit 5 [Xenogryllus marmoratus]
MCLLNCCTIFFFDMIVSFCCFVVGGYCCVMFLDWNLISLNSFSYLMVILLESIMSLLFMGFVLFISSLVIMYSDEYMEGDMTISRFILLVLMFVLSMIFLIISPNLISILLGWDGLGLVCYCLVIYYQNVNGSYNAGLLSALSIRVGDVALLMSIAWMLHYGSWNYIYYLEFESDSFIMLLIGGMLVSAGNTKSAQIPFSSCLPAAMAVAPTPVSSLVHSSTLVTAGVYLLIRFGDLVMYYNLSKYLLFIGCLTMFMAGIGANFEYDLKKIIALSTLSQLGLMMSTIGLGYYDLAFFHLLMHALFKALLFLCAGVIIHGVWDCQDIRVMGGIVNQMPLVSLCFMTSNLALCGMPFLSGYYSSDLILELSLMGNYNLLIFIMFFLSVGLTVCYTFRLIYYVMVCEFNFSSLHCLGDENYSFIFPMLMLMVMSVVGGSLMSWLMLMTPSLICMDYGLKMLTIIISFIGGWLGFELCNFNYYGSMTYNNQYVVSFLGSMWFMPFVSTYMLIYIPLYGGFKMFRENDHGWSEEVGGQGLFKFMMNLSNLNQEIQNNVFKLYLLGFILWFFILYMIV